MSHYPSKEAMITDACVPLSRLPDLISNLLYSTLLYSTPTPLNTHLSVFVVGHESLSLQRGYDHGRLCAPLSTTRSHRPHSKRDRRVFSPCTGRLHLHLHPLHITLSILFVAPLSISLTTPLITHPCDTHHPLNPSQVIAHAGDGNFHVLIMLDPLNPRYITLP